MTIISHSGICAVITPYINKMTKKSYITLEIEIYRIRPRRLMQLGRENKIAGLLRSRSAADKLPL